MSTLTLNAQKTLAKSPKPAILERDWKLHGVLRLLNIFGQCPISSVGTTQKYYFFQFRAPITIFCLITALYFGFASFITISHVSLKQFFIFGEEMRYTFKKFEDKFNADVYNGGATKAGTLGSIYGYLGLQGIYQIIMIFLSWMSASNLSLFLNRWITVEKKFSRTFPSQVFYPPNEARKDKSLGFHSKTCIRRSDLGTCIYLLITVIFPLIIVVLAFDSQAPLSHVWCILTFEANNIVSEGLGCVRNALIFKSCSDAFAKARSSIQLAIKWGRVNELTVQSWRHLLMEIQSQCILGGKSIMRMQLAALAFTLTGGTLLVYVSMSSFGRSSVAVVIATLAGSYVLSMIGRLYFNVVRAERITHVEAAIAADLIRMDSARYGSAVVSQIRLTYNALVQNPSRINLGNYVVLNRHLFLAVVSQVITYLIVLMQFIQPSFSGAS